MSLLSFNQTEASLHHVLNKSSPDSVVSLSQQMRPEGPRVSLSNYRIDWLFFKDFLPLFLHVSFSPLGESDQQILPNQQES